MRRIEPSAISRRSFLHSIIAAGAAPAFVPAHVLGANAPSEKITLGVIGVGSQGTQDMINFLGLEKMVRVTAICDVNQRNLARARERIAEVYGSPDVRVYSDFRELNADPSIDAVLMALPVHWHSIPALDAIQKGKHIFHEKPMAMSFEEARRVRAAVREKGIVFQFGTQQRSDLKFRWACELARNGRLGKLKEIEVVVPGGEAVDGLEEQPVPDFVDWDRWVGPAPESGFHERKLERSVHENLGAFSLGMISCWGIHHLDIAQWGNGTDETGPLSIEGTGIFPEDSSGAILDWNVRFEFAEATPVTFKGKGRVGVTFIGEDERLFVTRGELMAADGILRDPQNRYGTMPVKLPVSGHHAGNFIEAIRNGGRAICDIETAVRSDTLCQTALIAVKEGRKLRWDPVDEKFVGDEAANRLLMPRAFRGEWELAMG